MRNRKNTVFDCCIALALVLTLLWASVPYWAIQFYSDASLELLLLNGSGGRLPDEPYLYFLDVIAYLLCYVGLLLRMSWARILFPAVVLIDLGLAPISGAVVVISFDAMLYKVLLLLDGLILGLALFATDIWDSKTISVP